MFYEFFTYEQFFFQKLPRKKMLGDLFDMHDLMGKVLFAHIAKMKTIKLEMQSLEKKHRIIKQRHLLQSKHDEKGRKKKLCWFCQDINGKRD